MPLLETCTDHVRGEAFFTITAAETWSIAMVKRLKAKYPGEVEIRITNPDGSMVARLPFSWMRIVPKRKVDARLAENLHGAAGREAIDPNSDEQAPPYTGIPPKQKGGEGHNGT